MAFMCVFLSLSHLTVIRIQQVKFYLEVTPLSKTGLSQSVSQSSNRPNYRYRQEINAGANIWQVSERIDYRKRESDCGREGKNDRRVIWIFLLKALFLSFESYLSWQKIKMVLFSEHKLSFKHLTAETYIWEYTHLSNKKKSCLYTFNYIGIHQFIQHIYLCSSYG